MATLKQTRDNRRNARNGCGPSTREARLKASLKALTHGDSDGDFNKLLSNFTKDFNPQTPAEFELVQTLVKAITLRGRINAVINQSFNNDVLRRHHHNPTTKKQGTKPIST